MENSAIFAALSIIVVLLTSLFKQVSLTVKQKHLIATALSLVAGAALAYESGNISIDSVSTSAVAIYGGAQLAYSFIIRGTSLDKLLTQTQLFGKKSQEVESVLADAVAVEKAVRKTTRKKTTK